MVESFQLCINLTNEHMQRFLNQHIYDLEIHDCRQEGIETVDINYTDNHLVIETFLNVNIADVHRPTNDRFLFRNTRASSPFWTKKVGFLRPQIKHWQRNFTMDPVYNSAMSIPFPRTVARRSPFDITLHRSCTASLVCWRRTAISFRTPSSTWLEVKATLGRSSSIEDVFLLFQRVTTC